MPPRSMLPPKKKPKTATASTLKDIEDCTPREFPPDDVVVLRKSLLEWYSTHRRDLPWRRVGTSPYGVWVSEVMLQQTRVSTVVEYWHRWMQEFPNVASLAKAPRERVNEVWSGLGYYRRAASLHEGATMVMQEFNGNLPASHRDLLSIPGIGPYTAGAIASIAFNLPEPVVDGNVIRVFSRLLGWTKVDIKSPHTLKRCWQLASKLVDLVDPGNFNQALMEIGATVCMPQTVDCADCPLRPHCQAAAMVQQQKISKIPGVIPPLAVKAKAKEQTVAVCILHQQGVDGERYLLVKRPEDGLLADLWEFPCIPVAGELAKEEGDVARRCRVHVQKYLQRVGASPTSTMLLSPLQLPGTSSALYIGRLSMYMVVYGVCIGCTWTVLGTFLGPSKVPWCGEG
eukprot:EG_transcript_14923